MSKHEQTKRRTKNRRDRTHTSEPPRYRSRQIREQRQTRAKSRRVPIKTNLLTYFLVGKGLSPVCRSRRLGLIRSSEVEFPNGRRSVSLTCSTPTRLGRRRPEPKVEGAKNPSPSPDRDPTRPLGGRGPVRYGRQGVGLVNGRVEGKRFWKGLNVSPTPQSHLFPPVHEWSRRPGRRAGGPRGRCRPGRRAVASVEGLGGRRGSLGPPGPSVVVLGTTGIPVGPVDPSGSDHRTTPR